MAFSDEHDVAWSKVFDSHDLVRSVVEVRRRVDDDRRVAQPDADGRLARHVGLANIDLAARDHDQVGALHQLGRHGSRDGARQELHQVRRQSDLFQLAAHAVDRGLGCLPCRRRRRDDDGVAPLQRHHGLVHGGGRRIGRWRDGGHHANRLGVFDKAFFRNFLNHARGLDPQQVSQRPEGLALVLDNLAFDVADAGHFHGDFRQPPRIVWPVDRPGQSGHRLVDTALAEGVDFTGEFPHGAACRGDQRGDCIGLCVAGAHAPVAFDGFDSGHRPPRASLNCRHWRCYTAGLTAVCQLTLLRPFLLSTVGGCTKMPTMISRRPSTSATTRGRVSAACRGLRKTTSG